MSSVLTHVIFSFGLVDNFLFYLTNKWQLQNRRVQIKLIHPKWLGFFSPLTEEKTAWPVPFFLYDPVILYTSSDMLLFLLYFLALPFNTLILPPPQSPHCYPCPWVLSSLYSIPLSPNLPPLAIAVILHSMYESVYVWLVRLICSLDSTYEWNHLVFVFLWLGYFTKHNVLQMHPCCCKG